MRVCLPSLLSVYSAVWRHSCQVNADRMVLSSQQPVVSYWFAWELKALAGFWSPSASPTQLSILVFLSIFCSNLLFSLDLFVLFRSSHCHSCLIPWFSRVMSLASLNFNTSLASLEPLITSWGTLISFRYGFSKEALLYHSFCYLMPGPVLVFMHLLHSGSCLFL